MIFTGTGLQGAYIIEPELREDHRGFFGRMYCSREFAAHGLAENMVQSNLSRSHKKHTLRGMHYQTGAAAEAKLVRCLKGRILDVIIDIRPDSTSYGRHFKAELSEDNFKMMYVPEGFAHGFITLCDNCDVFYQVSNYYAPGSEGGIRWNDPAFGIEWPCIAPVISDKDRDYPDFRL